MHPAIISDKTYTFIVLYNLYAKMKKKVDIDFFFKKYHCLFKESQ